MSATVARTGQAPDPAPDLAPDLVVAVVGTGTEIGKTWVAAALITELRARGSTVWARKPAQSFAPGTGPTDADLLAAASGETPARVCPPHRWYPVPMAPPMAAAALGLPPPTVAELIRELGWDTIRPARDGPPSARAAAHPPLVGIVELAGGVRSPQAAGRGADAIGVLDALHPDHVVLVADAGLGTINSVRLCLGPLSPWPTTIVLNRFDPTDALHAANLEVLAADLDVGPDPRGRRCQVVVDVPGAADRLVPRHLYDT